ncbi:HAD-like protein [Daldinia vernicosa]|uniref:HAD-like protein n=1 Tax=Daldinia vernicosa TaxID=114800 RepID=UPI00200753BF|nr:HAD-like protein [Daldinia vernicosa]KAI0844261.1 HAD-like protein [Daldinia vernicosa]
MSPLHDYRLLSFDVYGTLIDYETGILSALEPFFASNNRTDIPRLKVLEAYHECEVKQQQETPDMPYSQLLSAIHHQLATKLGLAPPTAEESRAFSNSDIGSYKPNPQNFEYMLKEVKEKFGVNKDQVIQTAQSQFHDHHPARVMGIKSAWIVRPGVIMGNREKEIYDWKFNTLGDMADALEAELGAS